MVATLYLFACAFAIGQPAGESSEWQLLPRLGRGHELVYRGSYSEEATGPQVQFLRSYRLENRIFVLDSSAQELEIASLTIWKGRAAKPEASSELENSSVRLELGKVSAQGKVTGKGNASWLVPLDGPPIIESGAFVEVPRGRITVDQTWDVGEDTRPLRNWRVAGVETVNGTRCVKLVGSQQSDDWDRPRADSTAWRRNDTVWLAPRAGFAYKVERTIEQREPARTEATHRLVVKYELETSLQYPGQLYEDRRREITQIISFAEGVKSILPRASQVGPKPFELILSRINNHLENQAPTPYREAIRAVKSLVESGKRGETPISLNTPDVSPVAQIIGLGKQAPDFLATDLVTRESTRLRRWIGQPILLVFYNPTSVLGSDVLKYAQKVQNDGGGKVSVVALAVTEDAEKAVKQHEELKLTFPLLSGTGLRLSYGLETTPKLVVLDSNGTVMGSYLGWGPETPDSVANDLKRAQSTRK